MKYLKTFEKHKKTTSTLIIVDVQKSFRSFFTEMYLNKLKKYCKTFDAVYQIWDNHVDGKNIDLDYLYDDDPEVKKHHDLYQFPNQQDLIEKRYNYDVNIDFYKKILDKKTFNIVKNLESRGKLKRGQLFKTNEGTAIVYIGNNHKWFHIPIKLYNLFLSLKGKEVIIVGGADSECLEDVYIAGDSMGVLVKRNHTYIYSANHCPIK